MLQDSDEEKLSRIFMILFEKKVAKRSANDFEDSQVGRVVLWDLCRTLCNSLNHGYCQRLVSCNRQFCPCLQDDYTRQFDVEDNSCCIGFYLYAKLIQIDVSVT